MSEFIGSRISLISNSDIRYVGTLVEINSENSTVALEGVRSYGTEDRRTGEDTFPPSTSIYEYILFRGSDVKDLRIEEGPKDSAPQPPQIPNDPAIVGSARPTKPAGQTQPAKQPTPPNQAGGPPNASQPPQNFGPPQNQFSQYGGYGGGGGPMPPHGFGRGGFQAGFPPGGPSGPAFGGYPPGMFGPPGHHPQHGPPPPGWYPPPGHPATGFPTHFPPAMPHGPPGPPGQPLGKSGPPKENKPVEKDTDTKASVSVPDPIQKQPQTQKPVHPVAKAPAAAKAPPPPVESKPDVAAALAPPTQPAAQNAAKNRVAVPTVLPRPTQGKPATKATVTAVATVRQAPSTAPQNTVNLAAAEMAATAVSVAMDKLAAEQAAQGQRSTATENITRKLHELKVEGQVRHNQRESGFHRGRGRGGAFSKVEIPKTDFDFESSNKKFNKQDLLKEAAGVSPEPHTNGSAASEHAEEDPAQATQLYDRKTSFFDNISSELKDREEKRNYGAEFRAEERRKNVETFGQGSIDGFRGGFRGRGRGRGMLRGRGGGFRGGRGMSRGRGGAVADA